MKNEVQKKILVPVDGSDRAINTVKYIDRNDPFHRMRIVLFHVFSSVPESYWDMEKNVSSRTVAKQARAREMSQKKLIRDYMERAKGLLEKSGFPMESIETKIHNRRKGVARDIIQEARNGYTAVVIRRRGTTGLRGVMLGSVASKLVAKIVFIPLILVGKKPPGHRILMGFDGSQDAMQAVNFVGSVLGGFDFEVELLHVIREGELRLPETASIRPSKEFTTAAKKEMTSPYEEMA
jgi:nucleotide-binding universal stress UspA family protein